MRLFLTTLLIVPMIARAQPICAIQGTGDTSPYVGQQVTTEGFVTARFTGAGSLNGYFIEQPGCDALATTSNGIFVYAPNPGNIAVGQRVSVMGTVTEFNGLTEITSASHTVLGAGLVLPTDIDLPLDMIEHWEHFEGMLLGFPGQLMVVENEGWSQYGEVWLAPQRTMVPTDHVDPNDAVASGVAYSGSSNSGAVISAQSEADRSFVLLDDGRTTTWPTPAPWADAFGTLRSGSTVNNLVGVLHYAYGQYKVEPTGAVPFQQSARPSVPTLGGTIRAVGYNLHNYFTTLGGWGAVNAAELERQRTKLVAALQAMNADVLALCEMENNDAACADLLGALNGVLGTDTYALLEEDAFGQGTRTIILYKPAVLTPITDLFSLNTTLFQRPHLTQGFRLNATGGRFLFSTMHLRSKLCDGASGANEDQGDGQGCFNGMRLAQASALIDHWASLRNGTGIEAQLIMGDFNAYAQEDPIDRLRAAGLIRSAPPDGHTFGFEGLYGALDHVFCTAAMNTTITGTAVWHINADEPATLDYRDANATRYQPNAYRSGDHDPVLVGINGADLGVGLGEEVQESTVRFVLQGVHATWQMGPNSHNGGAIHIFDGRGALLRTIPMEQGVAALDLGGMTPGMLAWWVAGTRAAGRILLP